ncbi:MAG: HEAT repeat domain-containing protein [Myxococcales bacterium]|nr:HEAT repeat domain-containing protein [Myxococcales bacterium]
MEDEAVVLDPVEARFAVRKAFTAMDGVLRQGGSPGALTLDHIVEELGLALTAGPMLLNFGPNVVSMGTEIVHLADHFDGNAAGRLFEAGVRHLQLPQTADADQITALVRLIFAREGHDLGHALRTAPVGQADVVDPWVEHHRRRSKAFMGPYRAVLTALFPGVAGPPPSEARHRETVMMTEAVRRAEAAFAEAATECDTLSERLLAEGRAAWSEVRTGRHLLDLLVRVAMRQGQPLNPEQTADAIVGSLGLVGRGGDWKAVSDGLRGLRDLADAAADLDDKAAAARVFKLAGTGARAARMVARLAHLASPDFMAWARWFFHRYGQMEADELVDAFGGVTEPAGLAFLRDLVNWRDDLNPRWWLERIEDERPHVVTEALVALQRVELSARQREVVAKALTHPEPDTRLRALKLLGNTINTEIRTHFLTLLNDEDFKVRQAALARLVHLQDKHSASAIVTVVRSERFGEYDEDEQRRLFEALARLGGDRFIRAFRDILKLDEGGSRLGRLFRRETIPDDPIRRAAVYGLAALGTPDAIASLEQVARRGSRLLADLAGQLVEAATSGQLRADTLLSVAPSRIDAPNPPPSEDDNASTRMGEDRLFTPEDYGLSASASLEMLLQGYLSDAAAGPTELPKAAPAAPETAAKDPEAEPDPFGDPVFAEPAPPLTGMAAARKRARPVTAPVAKPAAAGSVGSDPFDPQGPGGSVGSLPPVVAEPIEGLMLEPDLVSSPAAAIEPAARTGDDGLPDFARTTLSLEPVRPGAALDFGALAAPGPAGPGDMADVFPVEDDGFEGFDRPSLAAPAETEAPSGFAPPVPAPTPAAEVAPELAALLADLGDTPPAEAGLALLDSAGPLGAADLSAGPEPASYALESDALPRLETNAPPGLVAASVGAGTGAPPFPEFDLPRTPSGPLTPPQTPLQTPPPPGPSVGTVPRRGNTGVLLPPPPAVAGGPRPSTGSLQGGERGAALPEVGLSGLKGNDSLAPEDDEPKGPTNEGLGSLIDNLFGDDG